jgi:hypothetical protein
MLNDELITETLEDKYDRLLEQLTELKPFLFKPKRDVKELAERLPNLTLLYKNGSPQYTIVDLDHGTRRYWGDGVISLYFEVDKC